MPDGIANYEVRGKTYVLTANEGDAREYDGFEDVDRAGSVADLDRGAGRRRRRRTRPPERDHDGTGDGRMPTAR